MARYEGTDGYQAEALEDDIFLSEVPVSLIKESIQEQFLDPMQNKTNYVSTFIDTYKVSVEQADDEDDLPYLRELKAEFYLFLRQLFRQHLSIGFPDFEDRDEDEQDQLMLCSYGYFILNIRKNFKRLALDYIDTYKDKVEEICVKHKDVTTIAHKKDIENEYDLLVLSNVYTIVESMMEDEDIDVDEFLRGSRGKNDYECEYVEEAYDDLKITGNFIEAYKEMLPRDFITNIATKVREKILKRNKNLEAPDEE